MTHVLPFEEEYPEFVALRVDTQMMVNVGKFHCIHDCMKHLSESDVRYVGVSSRQYAFQKLDEVLDLLPPDVDGKRMYLWLRYDSGEFEQLGYYPTYLDAVQDGARRLISPMRGMVVDTQKLRLWPLAILDTPYTTKH